MFQAVRTLFLVGVFCFTTKQEIQDGKQRELPVRSYVVNAGFQEVYIYLELNGACFKVQKLIVILFNFHCHS